MPERRLRERLVSLLRRRGCVSLAEAAAWLRATPSEVARAAEEAGAVRHADRICPGRRRRERGPLELEGLPVLLQGRDWVVARVGDCCLVALPAPRGKGLQALIAAARRAARLARRLLGETCSRGCKVVVPVLVSTSSASERLVEGVPVTRPESAVSGRPCSVTGRRYWCGERDWLNMLG